MRCVDKRPPHRSAKVRKWASALQLLRAVPEQGASAMLFSYVSFVFLVDLRPHLPGLQCDAISLGSVRMACDRAAAWYLLAYTLSSTWVIRAKA